MRMLKNIFYCTLISLMLIGCKAGGDNPGLEYAPNMYHSVAHEPLTQIVDESAGMWVNALDEDRGEYYNSNPLNPNRMTMRVPPANTVKRNAQGWLPYRIAKDSLEVAAKIESPLEETAALLAQGKVLYEYYCQHCHGAKGEGDGKVADAYPGIANLKGDAYKDISKGHIYHVITQGKGLMGAHGSQIQPEDRWKISHYVKNLQSK
ncbi:MAG TPA: cytochrome c [Cyclobacteriaceae bacterium]|nr:cytochrome c [Cyclobacteriaceae bacterium]